MSHPVRTLDVSALPTVAFGNRALTWWATTVFIIVETTTIAISLTTYFYLGRNFDTWPPNPQPYPGIVVPTLMLAALLLGNVPCLRAKKAALRFDYVETRRWMILGTLMAFVVVALRAWGLAELNVRWDANAYASTLWMIHGFHSLLLLADSIEKSVITAIFVTGRDEPKHYSDVEDVAVYQLFVSLIWVPCWFVIYVLPRLG